MRNFLTLFFLGWALVANAAIHVSSDLLISWPSTDQRSVTLLKTVGARAVFCPFPAPGVKAFVAAARQAGLAVVADLHATACGPRLKQQLDQARRAGFTGAAFPAACNEQALRDFLARQQGLELFVYLKPDQVAWNVAPAHAVLRDGTWPGIHPLNPTVASATHSAWADSNIYLIEYLNGMFPQRPALIAYQPDKKANVSKGRLLAYGSVELALAEARAAGGNVILALPADYRTALLAGKPKALAAWKSLAAMAGFLGRRVAQFHRPLATRVAVVGGTLEQSREILNLLYRRNGVPQVIRAADLTRVPLDAYRVVVVPGVALSQEQRAAVLARVRGGGWLFTIPAGNEKTNWWRQQPGLKLRKKKEDRSLYSLGKGSIAGYQDSFVDPSEFALDVLEAVGWRHRDLRMWAADPVIGILHAQAGGAMSVELVNYSRRRRRDFLVRLEKAFHRATLFEPGAPPQRLGVPYRRSGTELDIPSMGRFATILLERGAGAGK